MSEAWRRRKQWSDRFLPEIKQILGSHLIGEPPHEEDAERNTDLIVLRMEAVRIGCRVRKHKYLHERDGAYRDQFTIREGVPSGAKTELTKLLEGWGDYFFYGFCDEPQERLASWMLGDMNVFRLWFHRETVRRRGGLPGVRLPNRDEDDSTFRAFDIDSLPAEFVIARQQYEPQPEPVAGAEIPF